MSMNRKMKNNHPQAKCKRSWGLVISWSMFITVLLGLFSWVTLTPLPHSAQMSKAIVLDLPEAIPLEELVFSNTEELEDHALDDTYKAIWDLVTPNLVEETEFGLLPKVSQDGVEPWKAYSESIATNSKSPRIAVIVTNLGPDHIITSQAIEELPSPITLAFSPYTVPLNQCIKHARDHHHETLLTIALESKKSPTSNLSPHTLLTGLSPEENTARLQWILSQTGGYVGLVGLSGSQFLNTPEAFEPFFQNLKKRGLLFIDTQAIPLASQSAQNIQLPHLACSYVIQQTQAGESIEKQLQKVEKDSWRKRQVAVILQANSESLLALKKWTTGLSKRGITLVPIATLIPNLHPPVVMNQKVSQATEK